MPRKAKCWALLIGVNFYGPGRELNGAVNDVTAVKEYLEGFANSDTNDIKVLTATKAAHATTNRPVEEESSWPTFDNVEKCLTRILEDAEPKDRIHIYFSGHGACKPLEDRPNQSCLALVLIDVDPSAQRPPRDDYLDGDMLGTCLKRMGERGLLVTLVLDCCYSGSIYRGSAATQRSVKYDAAADRHRSTPLQWLGQSDKSTVRGAQLSTAEWLISPPNYSILAACAPHETCYEITASSGETMGALTYFLMGAIGALVKGSLTLNNETLYEELLVCFRARWEQKKQTPMLFGRRELMVLGDPLAASSTFASKAFRVFKMVDKLGRTLEDSLHVNAGEIHDISVGARFDLWPSDVDYRSSHPSGLARATLVGALNSAITVEPETLGGHKAIPRTGWQAIPKDVFPRYTTRIAFTAAAQARKGEASPVTDGQPVMQTWLETSHGPRQATPDFIVDVDSQDRYVVLDSLENLRVSLPKVPISAPGHHLHNLLQHISQFNYFRRLQNTYRANKALKDSFSFDVARASTVSHGKIWELRVRNTSQVPLYLAIYNLGSSWEIQDILCDNKGSSHSVLQPGKDEYEKVGILMEVPERLRKHGIHSCEDTFKVFVTSSKTYFPGILLPELSDESLYTGKALRGGHASQDVFSGLFQSLRNTNRGQGSITEDFWTCQSFVIRTEMTLPGQVDQEMSKT